MIGYMTKNEAIEYGFTHHGRYYFLPIYIATGGDIPMVAVKFLPLNYVFDLLWWLEQNLVTEGEIPNFTVGGPIVSEYPG